MLFFTACQPDKEDFNPEIPNGPEVGNNNTGFVACATCQPLFSITSKLRKLHKGFFLPNSQKTTPNPKVPFFGLTF